jgi:putative alpha-1,2-mannosidase
MQNRYYLHSIFRCTRIFLILFLSATSCINAEEKNTSSETRPVDLVEPLVDAANSRWFFFNSATRPFGMVNLSPDMIINGAWNSGYRYNEDTIRAFSHIHAWQLSGIPVFPTRGECTGHLGADFYGSAYSHENETVRPGYHQVLLEDYGINVELTSTKRVGFHRYTFPASEKSNILFDFSTFLGPCDTDSALIRKVSDTEIEGYAVMSPTRRRPKPVWVHFLAQLDQPFDALHGWKDGTPTGEFETLKGSETGCWMEFGTTAGEVRLMKVGISYVSSDQARLNKETELPHWDFDRIVEESSAEWNDMLGRIRITGGTETQQRRFYTDLWHALQGRRVISDVNGKYCDMTGGAHRTGQSTMAGSGGTGGSGTRISGTGGGGIGYSGTATHKRTGGNDTPKAYSRRIGQIPLDEEGLPRFNHYNSDSFWGAQWTLNTLWHLVYPEITEEFVNSMLLMYEDGGLIPRGPSGGNYTFVMTGASSTPFIVSAYMKGIRGFDAEKAYEGMKKNHMPGGLMSKAGYEHRTFTGGGLEYYIDRGYIPYPLPEAGNGFHEDGSGQTLEYAYQDWTLAQMARALGKTEDHDYFMNRSQNYRNIWYNEKGWMWIKDIDGQWREPFDELEYQDGWVESNAAQSTWFVPHDLKGLAALMGGPDSLVSKLNRSFELAQPRGFTASKRHADETQEDNRRTYINYGNQPSMQTAFIFNYAGAPWLTQKWSRLVTDSVYSGISPQYGYSGDEDQGLMGSLAVLMKMGIFSMKGGTATAPIYELGSPVFDRVTIRLNKDYYPGDSLVIETKNNAEAHWYIQSVTLNGERTDRAWIDHKSLVNGGILLLEMGPEPNRNIRGVE